MSFLGDLVNSIGTDKSPAPPPRPFQRQPTSSTVPQSKFITKSEAQTLPNLAQTNTLKRKADEVEDGVLPARPLKVAPPKSVQSRPISRPSTPVANGAKPGLPKSASVALTPTSATSAKAPPKGSYADIMARAKQAQEQRPGSQVGMIKHQVKTKEKVSKFGERKRGEQERSKLDKSRPLAKGSKPTDKGLKKRDASPIKKSEQVKGLKPPKPPLHAPRPTYKGTMNKASNMNRDKAIGKHAKRGRYDEYLGTDEEEDDEMEDYDDDGDDAEGYGSDQSSDMEAGWDELEGEETTTLRAAREDDAKELALENARKREKEERRERLTAMAKRGR